METSRQSFLGRQPILDRDRRVVGYELLFRDSAEAKRSVFSEVSKACVQVIATAFGTMGVDTVLGGCRGFFNISAEVLMTDMIEGLPRDRVILEILESTEATPDTAERCKELREQGFVLALDDYVPGDPRESLLDVVDMVKVDLPGLKPNELKSLVRRLERRPLLLLAEKVETEEEYELCRRLGFDLFQGFFFARPVVLEGGSIESDRAPLMDLLRYLSDDEGRQQAIDTLKRNADLSTSLLKVVNSVGLPTLTQIHRIEDAFRYMGPKRLQCWVMILLFAGADGAGLENPLFVLASRRGRLMELMIDAAGGSDRDRSSRAFLVGMCSLLDTLLSMPIERAIADLNLDTEIDRALVAREGSLGRLLGLVERIERLEDDDCDAIAAAIDEFGLSLGQLQVLDIEAHAWVHELSTEQAA